MKKVYIIIFSMFFLFTCGDPASADENGGGGADNRTKITMTMDENLILTLSVENLAEDLNYLSFSLAYDYTKLSASIVSGTGDFPIQYPANNLPAPENDDYLPILFSNILENGELIKVQFTGSSYEGTTIYLEDILLVDSNNSEIPDNSEALSAAAICYINQHPTNGDTYADYSWRTDFCWPIQTDWRE